MCRYNTLFKKYIENTIKESEKTGLEAENLLLTTPYIYISYIVENLKANPSKSAIYFNVFSNTKWLYINTQCLKT